MVGHRYQPLRSQLDTYNGQMCSLTLDRLQAKQSPFSVTEVKRNTKQRQQKAPQNQSQSVRRQQSPPASLFEQVRRGILG